MVALFLAGCSDGFSIVGGGRDAAGPGIVDDAGDEPDDGFASSFDAWSDSVDDDADLAQHFDIVPHDGPSGFVTVAVSIGSGRDATAADVQADQPGMDAVTDARPTCGAPGEACCPDMGCASGNGCSGGICVSQDAGELDVPNDVGFVVCGLAGYPCCLRGTDCTAGACYDGYCVTCGVNGFACCAGGRCDPGLVCVGGLETGVCNSPADAGVSGGGGGGGGGGDPPPACGSPGLPCCAGGECSPGSMCVSGICSAVSACGTMASPCCDGGTCNAPLVCNAGICGAAPAVCGGPGETCCPGGVCDTSGFTCDPTMNYCTVTCGRGGTPCCTPDFCIPGFTCSAGSCVVASGADGG